MSNPNPTPGGPPLRALAMVLIALAIVFAGLGAMSLSNSESSAAEETVAETPASTTTTTVVAQVPATTASSSAPPVTTTTASSAPATTTTPTTTTAAASGAGDRSVSVQVLNNSMVSGLAARRASELTASGWTNVSAGNYNGANLTTTTVYYGPGAGDKAAATAVAAQVGGTVAAKTSGYSDNAPGVVVILTGN